MCRRQGVRLRPRAYESRALLTELRRHNILLSTIRRARHVTCRSVAGSRIERES